MTVFQFERHVDHSDHACV